MKPIDRKMTKMFSQIAALAIQLYRFNVRIWLRKQPLKIDRQQTFVCSTGCYSHNDPDHDGNNEAYVSSSKLI